MQYVRLYADAAGESHFEDVQVQLFPVNFAPPAPPMDISAPIQASQFMFLGGPAGWSGDFHPAPRRQFLCCLIGEYEVVTSDGETRKFGPGSILLAEDTTGKGHVTRIIGEGYNVAAVIQLPD